MKGPSKQRHEPAEDALYPTSEEARAAVLAFLAGRPGGTSAPRMADHFGSPPSRAFFGRTRLSHFLTMMLEWGDLEVMPHPFRKHFRLYAVAGEKGQLPLPFADMEPSPPPPPRVHVKRVRPSLQQQLPIPMAIRLPAEMPPDAELPGWTVRLYAERGRLAEQVAQFPAGDPLGAELATLLTFVEGDLRRLGYLEER